MSPEERERPLEAVTIIVVKTMTEDTSACVTVICEVQSRVLYSTVNKFEYQFVTYCHYKPKGHQHIFFFYSNSCRFVEYAQTNAIIIERKSVVSVIMHTRQCLKQFVSSFSELSLPSRQNFKHRITWNWCTSHWKLESNSPLIIPFHFSIFLPLPLFFPTCRNLPPE